MRIINPTYEPISVNLPISVHNYEKSTVTTTIPRQYPHPQQAPHDGQEQH